MLQLELNFISMIITFCKLNSNYYCFCNRKKFYGMKLNMKKYLWFVEAGGKNKILNDVLKSGTEGKVHPVKGGIQINHYLTYNWYSILYFI